jgi:hypothetical protein
LQKESVIDHYRQRSLCRAEVQESIVGALLNGQQDRIAGHSGKFYHDRLITRGKSGWNLDIDLIETNKAGR